MFWTWRPTFLVKTRGFTLSGSILWMIVTQVGALAGGVAIGITPDRPGRRAALRPDYRAGHGSIATGDFAARGPEHRRRGHL